MGLNIRSALGILIMVAWLGTSATADEVKRFAANGSEFAYVEAGQGDPIVFVHGLWLLPAQIDSPAWRLQAVTSSLPSCRLRLLRR